MKTIGIIGIGSGQFNNWCKTRQLKRKRDNLYYDVYTDTEYVHIYHSYDAVGREFDGIIDLDHSRLDLLYRLKKDGKYKILDYEFKRSR